MAVGLPPHSLESKYTQWAIISETLGFYRRNSGNRCYFYVCHHTQDMLHVNHPQFTCSPFTLLKLQSCVIMMSLPTLVFYVFYNGLYEGR